MNQKISNYNARPDAVASAGRNEVLRNTYWLLALSIKGLPT